MSASLWRVNLLVRPQTSFSEYSRAPPFLLPHRRTASNLGDLLLVDGSCLMVSLWRIHRVTDLPQPFSVSSTTDPFFSSSFNFFFVAEHPVGLSCTFLLRFSAEASNTANAKTQRRPLALAGKTVQRGVTSASWCMEFHLRNPILPIATSLRNYRLPGDQRIGPPQWHGKLQQDGVSEAQRSELSAVKKQERRLAGEHPRTGPMTPPPLRKLPTNEPRSAPRSLRNFIFVPLRRKTRFFTSAEDDKDKRTKESKKALFGDIPNA